LIGPTQKKKKNEKKHTHTLENQEQKAKKIKKQFQPYNTQPYYTKH
jgi:hypothetical protein